MPTEIQIRNACNSDIEFVIETIIQAEKGTGGIISYCKLFNISEDKFRFVLRQIIAEGINNFEFSLCNFKIAEIEGVQVGAYGAWLENEGGIPSGMLKISAFKSFLGKEHMAMYKLAAPVSDEIAIRRKPGTIQFESIFIKEEFRGKRIGNLLVQGLLDELTKKHPTVEVAQVQVIKQNSVSLQAHLGYGFSISEEKTALNPKILTFYSGNTRLLLEKKLR